MTPLASLADSLHAGNERRSQLLYPLVDQEGKLRGTITRNTLHSLLENRPRRDTPLTELATTEPVVAYADEPLRAVVNRMAESGYTRFPVVDREAGGKLVGMIALHDLLARAHASAGSRRAARARAAHPLSL